MGFAWCIIYNSMWWNVTQANRTSWAYLSLQNPGIVTVRVQLHPSGQQTYSQYMVASKEQLHCSEYPSDHDISPT